MSPAEQTPGAYRAVDLRPVAFEDAVEAWASAAVAVLRTRARGYGATVGYGDLARALFTRSGLATRSLVQSWIGDVLARVADICADPANDHPPLTALVVRDTDGAVGAGYADAVERHTGSRPDDVEQHAAEARLECYRALSGDLPADGGQAVRTVRSGTTTTRPRASRAAAAPKVAAPLPPPPPRCPTCHMELPRSGQCDTCD